MKFKIFHSSFNRSWWGNLLVFMFLAVFGLFFIFPIFYSVLNAFKPLEEILIFPPRLYIENPTFDNFLELAMLMEDSWVPLSRYLFNSAIVSILGTAGHLLLSSMAAYPMAKINFPGRKVFQKVIVMSLLFSASVTYIPTYIVMDQLHLIDNPLAVILPAWASSLGLYLMMNFMTNLPDSMLEAARIDGASEFRIYWQVVMPNVKPAWMTLIIFSFQAMWNNTGASYLYSEELKMLPSIIGTITAGGVRRTGVSAAAALLMMLPPILIFVFSQNNVIETMSSSGLKE
jgi:ABC-type glycerol-3-phosphate transport system permease component